MELTYHSYFYLEVKGHFTIVKVSHNREVTALKIFTINSFQGLRKEYISLSWWRRFHPFSLEPESTACN